MVNVQVDLPGPTTQQGMQGASLPKEEKGGKDLVDKQEI